MTVAVDQKCPVCRAPFRAATCPRCGADLTPLFRLLAEAHDARCRAREALLADDLETAARLADRAQELAASPAGARLQELVRWLGALAQSTSALNTASTGSE